MIGCSRVLDIIASRQVSHGRVYKVQLFWEVHKNLRHPPYGFDIYLVNVKTIRRMWPFQKSWTLTAKRIFVSSCCEEFWNCTQACNWRCMTPRFFIRSSEFDKNFSYLHWIIFDILSKGQIISKCPFGVFKSPKKSTKFFPGFLP